MTSSGSRAKPQTKEAIRDCIRFAVELLTKTLAELDRIETIPMNEDRKDGAGLSYPGSGVAFALGRAQGIAFGIRTELDFVKAELESCLPAAALPQVPDPSPLVNGGFPQSPGKEDL